MGVVEDCSFFGEVFPFDDAEDEEFWFDDEDDVEDSTTLLLLLLLLDRVNPLGVVPKIALNVVLLIMGEVETKEALELGGNPFKFGENGKFEVPPDPFKEVEVDGIGKGPPEEMDCSK